MKKIFVEVVLWIAGFIVTVLLPPFIFTAVTWVVFPRLELSFIQLFWIIDMIWLCLNYITITIGKSIEQLKNKI